MSSSKAMPVLFAARRGQRIARLEKALESQPDWNLHLARTGDSTLRLLNGPLFRLAIIDAGLPVVSALEVCRILRGRPLTANLPIVILEFENIGPRRESVAFAAGADDYVDGSAAPSVILDRVRSALARRAFSVPSHSGADAYRNGELYACFEDAFVSVGGQPIVMQRLEFALLQYFIEHKNKLVTRDDLFRDVWRGKGTKDSRTIDVHVCRLRKRLGPAADHVQTLIHLGYRFVDTPGAPSSAGTRAPGSLGGR